MRHKHPHPQVISPHKEHTYAKWLGKKSGLNYRVEAGFPLLLSSPHSARSIFHFAGHKGHLDTLPTHLLQGGKIQKSLLRKIDWQAPNSMQRLLKVSLFKR